MNSALIFLVSELLVKNLNLVGDKYPKVALYSHILQPMKQEIVDISNSYITSSLNSVLNINHVFNSLAALLVLDQISVSNVCSYFLDRRMICIRESSNTKSDLAESLKQFISYVFDSLQIYYQLFLKSNNIGFREMIQRKLRSDRDGVLAIRRMYSDRVEIEEVFQHLPDNVTQFIPKADMEFKLLRNDICANVEAWFKDLSTVIALVADQGTITSGIECTNLQSLLQSHVQSTERNTDNEICWEEVFRH